MRLVHLQILLEYFKMLTFQLGLRQAGSQVAAVQLASRCSCCVGFIVPLHVSDAACCSGLLSMVHQQTADWCLKRRFQLAELHQLIISAVSFIIPDHQRPCRIQAQASGTAYSATLMPRALLLHT